MTSDKPVDEVKSKSVDAVSNDHGSSKPKPAPRKFKCGFCGYKHIKGKCPAYCYRMARSSDIEFN